MKKKVVMAGFVSDFLTAGANSLIGGTIEALGSINAGKRQEARQKRLMDYEDMIADENYAKQLADQRQLIDEERLYNDYASVMSRSAAAGVNPLYAIGAPSTGGNISTSTPSQGDPSIPGVSQDPQQVAFSSIGSAVGQMAENAVKIRQAENLKVTTDFLEKSEDLRLQSIEYANKVAASVESVNNATADMLPSQKAFYEASKDQALALADRTRQLTPHEVDNLMADYQQKCVEYLKTNIEADILQATFVPTVLGSWASAWDTLASAAYKQEATRWIGYDAKTRRYSYQEDKRHNQAMEKIQSDYNSALKEFQDASIAVEQDKVDQAALQTWINAGFKLITIAAGAGVGFLIGGPVGAGVGASIGAGVSLGNPFESSLSKQFSPPVRKAGF